LHIFNTDAYQKIRSRYLGAMGFKMEIKQDNSQLFVGLASDQVAVIDLTSLTLVSKIALPLDSKPQLKIDAPQNLSLYTFLLGFNDIMHVADESQYWQIDVSTLPAVVLGAIPKESNTFYPAGRSHDRTKMYTSINSTGAPVTQWDITAGTPTVLQTGNGLAYFMPRIVPSPDDLSFIPISAGSNGEVSVYGSANMLALGTLRVEWDVIAAAFNLTGEQIAVAHSTTLEYSGVTFGRHNPHLQDVHIFDSSTYTEIAKYSVPGYVKKDGIAYGPDGRIYVLLGDRKKPGPEYSWTHVVASSIGVIVGE
jgi:hypothetical protein